MEVGSIEGGYVQQQPQAAPSEQPAPPEQPAPADSSQSSPEPAPPPPEVENLERAVDIFV